MFSFDAHRLIDSMFWVRADLYGTVATSGEEVLKDKALLKKEVKKLSDDEDGRVKKLTGELDVCHQKLQTVRDSLMEQGTTITQLEKQIKPLSLKPSHVRKP